MRKTKFLTTVVFFVLVALYACHKDPPRAVDRTGCLPGNLQVGVIAFYPFGNGSLADASGMGNDLTNSTMASPAPDRDGNVNCAYQFAAAQGDYLTRANPAFLDNLPKQQFSISLWYKPTGNYSGADCPELLIGRGDGLHSPDTYGSWSVGLFDCRRIVLGLNMESMYDLSYGQDCSGYMTKTTNSWHHAVVTFDGNVQRLYRDGVLLSTSVGPAGVGASPNVGDLLLGKYFTGLLDDVVIYDRVLGIGEVKQLMGLAGCCG